jgi:hypothetical protein
MSCAESIALEGLSALSARLVISPLKLAFIHPRSDSLAVHIIDEAFIFQVDRGEE